MWSQGEWFGFALLEWWKQEFSLHLQELNELNQQISYPCWDCDLFCLEAPLKGLCQGQVVSSPQFRSRNPVRGGEDEDDCLGSHCRTVLSWFAIGQRRDISHKSILWRRDRNIAVLLYFLAQQIPSSPPPAASVLEIWRKKKRKKY